jgi:hypothetical protein
LWLVLLLSLLLGGRGWFDLPWRLLVSKYT